MKFVMTAGRLRNWMDQRRAMNQNYTGPYISKTITLWNDCVALTEIKVGEQVFEAPADSILYEGDPGKYFIIPEDVECIVDIRDPEELRDFLITELNKLGA